jgi:regulator of nucleoside diphosphate kinase
MSAIAIHLSKNDHEMLVLLLQSLARQPVSTDHLRAEIARAIVCDNATLPRGTIGINSRVQLQDLDGGEVEEYVLTLPAGADADRRRLSVLAPVGTALLGYHEGDEIAWPTPGGTRRLKVLQVTPEKTAPSSVYDLLGRGAR